MIKEFTYPLPDELFVEGVSGNNVGTFVYDGPDEFIVEISTIGRVKKLNIDPNSNLEERYKKTINATTDTALAHIILSSYGMLNNQQEYEYEYEDEIMDNGDVYKKPLNPQLADAYDAVFNFQTDEWEIVQIVIDQINPSTSEALRRKEYVQGYSEKYSFGSEIDLAIDEYLEALNNFIENNPPLKVWKYININFNSVPKIPVAIVAEFAKIPSEGVV